MKRCPRCKVDFTADRKFCEVCGNRLVESAASPVNSARCPQCNEPVQPEWKFCKNCRARLVADIPNHPRILPDVAHVSAGITSNVPTPTASPDADLKVLIRCFGCKQLVDEDSAFCEFCGASLAEQIAPPSPMSSEPSQLAEPSTPAASGQIEDGGSGLRPKISEAGLLAPEIDSRQSSALSVAHDIAPASRFIEPSGSPQIDLQSERFARLPEVTTTQPSYGSIGRVATPLPSEADVLPFDYRPEPITEPVNPARNSRWLFGVLAVLVTLVVVGGVATGGVFLWRYRQARAPSLTSSNSNATAANPSAPQGMVYVAGGKFQMGRDDGDEYEKPAHEVIVSPFFIDKYEVTCEDYQKFVDATGRRAPTNWKNGRHPTGFQRLPVTGITWEDANAYAQWAGKRLPTEQEWEFAARGSDGRKYTWGNDWEANAANSADTNANNLVEVGSYPAGNSAVGAADMIGNAWEWTASDLIAYPGGRLPSQLGRNAKVIRGGSWKEDKSQATTTYRGFLAATGAKDYSATGFRCAKDVGSP